MYGRDCGKSMCMDDVFLPYYRGGGLWQINMHERCFFHNIEEVIMNGSDCGKLI